MEPYLLNEDGYIDGQLCETDESGEEIYGWWQKGDKVEE